MLCKCLLTYLFDSKNDKDTWKAAHGKQQTTTKVLDTITADGIAIESGKNVTFLPSSMTEFTTFQALHARTEHGDH